MNTRWPDCGVLDLLRSEARATVWAFLVVFQPSWVHSCFPCTFWSPLSRWTCRRGPEQDETLRAEALVHVRFTVQVMEWQCRRGAQASYENPPGCASHKLDIVQGLRRTWQLERYETASCAWGARDPDTGEPWLHRMTFTSNRNLACIVKPCSCPGKHGCIQGTVQGGKRRSSLSGQYLPQLCRSLVLDFKARLSAA